MHSNTIEYIIKRIAGVNSTGLRKHDGPIAVQAPALGAGCLVKQRHRSTFECCVESSISL